MGKIKTILGVVIGLFLVSLLLSRFIETDVGDKIAIIPLTGTIVTTSNAPLFSATTQTSGDIVKLLDEAKKNENIKGVVLAINSPGGTVVASKEIVEAVKGMEKPVVAWIREIGTSGAYWVASASDTIVADELSLTGSIGVVSGFLEFSQLMEDYGVTYESLKTGKYKDIGSPFRAMTEEERNLLLQKMQTVHEFFVHDVSVNRNLPEETVEKLATGIYYLGTEAKDLGLIDRFGGKELAVNITKELAQAPDATVITLETDKGLLDLLNKISSQAFFFLGRGIGIELTPRVDRQNLQLFT